MVGAGPAGIALARALGRAGRAVTLLESGADDASALDQELNDGDVQGARYAGLRRTRARGFGGAANVWNVEIGSNRGAKYAPLDACDLRSWPFGWEALAPFYAAAQEVCGLGRFAYEADAWAGDGRRPFDLRGTGLTSRVYQFGSAERFTRELRAELQRMENVRIVTSATVVGLVLDASRRRVLGVRVADAAGAVAELRAGRVVLACGAVENARLLLLAGADVGAEAGAAWLGRGFMEHGRDFSMVLTPSSPELFARASFYDLHTASCGTSVGGRLSLHEDAVERLDVPNAALTLIAQEAAGASPSRLRRWLRRWTGASPGAGAERPRYGWSRLPARRFAVFGMVLNLEQRPDPRNRIQLGARRDRFGNPLPHLSLEWSPDEQVRLDRLRGLLGEWFRGAGLGALRYEHGRRPDLSAHHHAGTTRMAERPGDGVVDPDGAVFGLDNLYVTGASVMPTAGFANPTLTVVALALRLARHLECLGDA